MIENIKNDIFDWIDEIPKGDFFSVKMIFEKFFIEREEFSIGLPGYFKGWVYPINNLLKKYPKAMKIKKGWIKL